MQQTERGEFGVFDASEYHVGIVRGAFNNDITETLLLRALEACKEYRVKEEMIKIHAVPGSVEIPAILRAMAESKKFDCLIALGAVIRGETPHFDYVLKIASEGITGVIMNYGIPVGFGILACNTKEQAMARLNSGRDAAIAALHSAKIIKEL